MKLNLKVGDDVRFVAAHHSMNPRLKRHEGELGTVVVVNESRGDALVQFDNRYVPGPVFGDWWIKSTRLCVVHNAELLRAVECYQWMPNAEDGQEHGNRQMLVPLDCDSFSQYVKPLVREDMGSLVAYQRANPGHSHVSIVSLDRGRSWRAMPPGTGPLEHLRPCPDDPRWVLKVDDFNSPEALRQAGTADSTLDAMPDTDVSDSRHGSAAMAVEPLLDAMETDDE